jgi:hypothetical protein
VTIAVVQSKTFNGAISGSLNGNVTAGNSVIMWQFLYNNAVANMSTSNPTFGGSAVTGAAKLFEVQAGTGNNIYVAAWLLPNLAGGAASLALTQSNGLVDSNIGMVAAEFSGLGTAPAIDSGASPNPKTTPNNSGTNPASGATGAITSAPQLVIGGAIEYAVALTPPGAFTNFSPGSSFCQCGYQIVTSSGATYNYATTSGGTQSWSAGVVTVAPPATGSVAPFYPFRQAVRSRTSRAVPSGLIYSRVA